MPRKTISATIKNSIAARQGHKCNKVEGYDCPFVDRTFDEAGFEIDHIVELADGGTDEESNLQALCHCCHAYKTSKNAMKRAKKPPVPKVKVSLQTLRSNLASKSEYEQDQYISVLTGKPTYMRLYLEKKGIPFDELTFAGSGGNHRTLVFDINELVKVLHKKITVE